MSQTPQLSPELARGLLQLSGTLVSAARSWTLYPSDHPSVAHSIARLVDAVGQVSHGGFLSIGITPETLLVEGASADRNQTAIAEAARFLHDRDLLQITFVGQVPPDALPPLLKLLALDQDERRRQGGPASIWSAEGHPSITIEQVDYRRVLEQEPQTPAAARRDDVWRSIVLSIAAGQLTFDRAAQDRLLAIAGSPHDIGNLATAVMASKCTPDGSPIVTSQAAAVLAAFRHLTNIVSVVSPERMPEVLHNLAGAAITIDPHVVAQVMQTPENPGEPASVVRGMVAAFDDEKVAQFLATTLALDGQATGRLATIFDTIVPDRDRKRRVMTLTRTLLRESEFGGSDRFQMLWASMEELLVSYNEKPFVPEAYRAELDGLGERVDIIAAAEVPPELPAWMETLGQDNVRSMSVALLIDLLDIEPEDARASDIARDMGALAEDLLMSGAYTDAAVVVGRLAALAKRTGAPGGEGSRGALNDLGDSLAMRETLSLIGELDDRAWQTIRDIVALVGPSSVEALKPIIMVEEETLASRRAADLIVALGPPAVPRLSSLAGDSRWFVQRAGARLLGRLATAEAIPSLQPLVRKPDPRVVRAAISALANIADPAAARVIHTVLRAATGEFRQVVVDALVADRDPRVVPTLTRILDESEPLGPDYEVVLETLSALKLLGSDQAVAPIARIIGCRRLLRRNKQRAIKERGVDTLAAIGGPAASAALADLARTGDRMLKKVIAVRRGERT